MTQLFSLGYRLARAGGPLRAGSVAAGNAIGVFLLLLAVALPTALVPDPLQRGQQLPAILTALGFLLLPALVLLITVGRLSSGVRDRRLASLRQIGLTPGRARIGAGVENGLLGGLGALLGLLLFLVTAPVIGSARLGGLGPMRGELRVPIGAALGVLFGVIAVSVLVGTAATWERGSIAAARSEATHRRPKPWRLLVLAAGLGVLIRVAGWDIGPELSNDPGPTRWFLVGAVLTGIGLALATPLIVDLLATLALRWRGSSAVTLAARAVQADAVGSARVVAGIGVAVFLVTAGLGFLGMNESISHLARAIRAFNDGPQGLALHPLTPDNVGNFNDLSDSPDAIGADMAELQRQLFRQDGDFSSAALAEIAAELRAVPGVIDVVGQWQANAINNGWPLPVFIGDCAALAHALSLDGVSASGCVDGQSALIANPRLSPIEWPDEDGQLRPIGYGLGDSGAIAVTMGSGWADDPSLGEIDVAGPQITLTRPRGSTNMVTEYVAFVPEELAASRLPDGLPPAQLTVIAAGGAPVQQRVAEWATAHGFVSEQPYERDWQVVQNLRTVVYALSGVALGTALLGLALTAADRAMERRRSVARQVMVGVPGRVLRTGQLLQVLTPAVVSGGIALAAGALGARAVTNLMQGSAFISGGTWAALVGIVLLGAVLVGLSTLPLVATKLTPELLRRE